MVSCVVCVVIKYIFLVVEELLSVVVVENVVGVVACGVEFVVRIVIFVEMPVGLFDVGVVEIIFRVVVSVFVVVVVVVVVEISDVAVVFIVVEVFVVSIVVVKAVVVVV